MNVLNLNKLSLKSKLSSKFRRRIIVGVFGFALFIFAPPAFAEETNASDKPPATGPISANMKKLSSPQGIITDFPTVPANIIKQAGYILSTPESEGSIIDSLAKFARFGLDELVYIDIGSERSVSPGDRFAVARYDQFIHHPVPNPSSSEFPDSFKSLKEYSWGSSEEGKPLGYLVRILGELEILEVSKDISKAIIRESYEDMMVGDRIINTQTPPVLLDIEERPDKNIEGYIVASKIASSLLAMTDIVYLDVGRNQNVAMGDRFDVYIFPDTQAGEEVLPEMVGELLAINIQNDTSSAVILKGGDGLRIGRKIRYKK